MRIRAILFIHLISRNARDSRVERRPSASPPGMRIRDGSAAGFRGQERAIRTIADDGRALKARMRGPRQGCREGLRISKKRRTLWTNPAELHLRSSLPGFSSTKIGQISRRVRRGVGAGWVGHHPSSRSPTHDRKSASGTRQWGRYSPFPAAHRLSCRCFARPPRRAVAARRCLLSLVREIPAHRVRQDPARSAAETLVVGKCCWLVSLASPPGWPPSTAIPNTGFHADRRAQLHPRRRQLCFGRDDAVIKSLEDFRPRAWRVTTLSNGQIVLILDMKELLSDFRAASRRRSRYAGPWNFPIVLVVNS